MNVEIVHIAPKRLACVRHVGPYPEAGKAWETLLAWAGATGVLRPDTENLGFSHDDPSTVPSSDLRYDACITVPEGVEGEGEVHIREFAGGDYARYLHTGPFDGLMEVYRTLYMEWLPQSGREAREEPPFETCLTDPHTTPPEELRTQVHIPLK